MPKLEEMRPWEKLHLLPEKKEEKEWVSPDGKLKLTHPGDWLAMDENFLKHLNQPKVFLVETKILFFAYQFKIKEQSLAFLMVGEIGPEKTLEEIIEEIKRNVERQNGQIEITILDTEDKVTRLEIISTVPGQPNFYSKGKIIFSTKKTYLIMLSVPQKDWPQFKQEVEKILDSVQLDMVQ